MRFDSAFAALALSGVTAAHRLHGTSYQKEKRELFARAPFDAKRVTGPYIEVKAPYENIFAPITEDEEMSIQRFIDRQLNKTIPGNLEFYSEAWLLPPNKTEATDYLSDKGPKPARYARIMGETWNGCSSTEYMIGPLPISEQTTAAPAHYVNGGNATTEIPNCGDWDEEDDEFLSDPSDRQGTYGDPRQGADVRKRNIDKRNIERRSPHNPYGEKMRWDGTDLPHDDKAPPVAILPDGARHEFDPKQNYVSWMEFTFFVSNGPGGITLHDVRFQGERVIYEMAMQEALAIYAGPGEGQTTASYLDVSIGFTNYNLIPGYDCPAYATYTDAFCLFEYPKDYPMSRHEGYTYYHATKNIAFILRSVSTVDNYDYQTTYEFYNDGSIQVLVRASGYIQGDNDVNATTASSYGFRIRDKLSGSMHDHVLNFKADLDILGTDNSLQKTEFVPHSQVYPWSEGQVINTMKVDRSFITGEDEGRIDWAPNSAAAYAVVNKDKQNQYGEYPGFRIYPSTGSSIHNTVENSTTFPDQLGWATHPLYALQRKDSEPISSHPMAYIDSLVDFDGFFDGESLEQEDLVLYFNLGMHHMPDTYDLPVTVMQGAQSGITFRPQNYGRSQASLSTKQQIHITNEDGKAKVEEYGAKLSGSFDLSSANPSKFPIPDEDWDEEEEEDW